MRTTMYARKVAMQEIPKILTDAGLQEGELLELDEIKRTRKTLFWYKRVNTEIASIKPTFLTWNLIASDPVGHADNRVASRQIFVIIDLYTKMSDVDSRLQKLLEKIEKQMLLNGWEFELVAAPSYDTENNLNQLSYSATKKI